MILHQESAWAETVWTMDEIVDAIRKVESTGCGVDDVYPFHRRYHHKSEDMKSRGWWGLTNIAQKELVRVVLLDKVYVFDGTNEEAERDVVAKYVGHMILLHAKDPNGPKNLVEAAGWYHAGHDKEERKVYRLKIRNALERARNKVNE